MQEWERLTDVELAQRFRAHDEQAAAALYHRYAWRLLLIARTSCGKSFASRFDPEDAVQGAYQELFDRLRRTDEQDVPHVDLWGLLVVLTRQHVRRMVEHHSASKRAVHRTCQTDGEETKHTVTDPRASDPHGMMIFKEQLEKLATDDRAVVNLRLHGYEVAEIVEQTGRPRRTVERVLQHFRDTVADLMVQAKR